MRLIRQRYQQIPHSCCSSTEDPYVEVEIMDAGGGEYLVLNAHEIALDNATEVKAFAGILMAMLEEVDDGQGISEDRQDQESSDQACDHGAPGEDCGSGVFGCVAAEQS